MQFWLSDLAQFDSSLVRVTVDGSYGATTERAVRAFQQKQGLTADGVVGQRTWNALYAAWVDAQSDLGGTAWPGTALRRGAAGMEVRLVQFWLRLAADNYSALRTVTVDGSYGAATVSAVEAFQTLFGLTPDGVVGRSTWNKLKEVGLAVANKIVAANVAPGQFTTTTRAAAAAPPCGPCNTTCGGWRPTTAMCRAWPWTENSVRRRRGPLRRGSPAPD